MIYRIDIEVDGVATSILTASPYETGDDQPKATLQIQAKGLPAASISRLYVSPAYRRTGLASQLMTVAESIARQYACQSIGMIVKPENNAARMLYLKLGYIVGYIYPDGDLVMCKSLMLVK
jgi:ribosomal protein S18 acetylase RimI-like enzyme